MSDGLDTSNFVTTDVADIDAARVAAADTADKVAEAEAEAIAAKAPESDEEIIPDPEHKAGDEGDEPAPKPKKTFQERMDEVTKARREAEREAAHWRKIAEANAAPANDTAEEPSANAGPNPDDFEYGETDPKYIAALVAHETKKGVDEVRRSMAQDAADQAQARVWEAAQDAARAEFDDFDTVIAAKDEAGAVAWDCSPVMAQTIRSMPDGGLLAYALASDPAQSKRIAAMDTPLQLIEAGRMMARISASKAPPAKQPKTATDAPEPPSNTARGAGGRFTVAADTDDFAAFEQQHASKWFAA